MILLKEGLNLGCFPLNFTNFFQKRFYIEDFRLASSGFPHKKFKKDVDPCVGYSSHNKNFRSSRLQMFFKIGVLKNFVIFTGKRLCWSFFLTKLQALRPATLLKRDSNTGVFL